MGFYLVDHPPRHQQFRCPRRERPSGIIGVHTAESFPDESGPDTGAENVARFIASRTNYGSYHLLADSDSVVQLVDYDCVAYHIATHGLNEHTIGISAATQAHKWDELDPRWVDDTVRNMARASADAARWLQREYGITVPARRISLAEALDGQRGFLAHGDADPDRRTDPGSEFPWGRFLGYYAAEMGDDMPPKDWDAEDWRAVRENATHGYGAWGYGELVGKEFGVILAELHHDLAGRPVQHPGDPDKSEPIAFALHMLRRDSNHRDGQVAQLLLQQQEIMRSAGAEVDEAAVAQAVAAIVTPAVVDALGELVGLTAAQVEQAAERAVRNVLREGVDSDAADGA